MCNELNFDLSRWWLGYSKVYFSPVEKDVQHIAPSRITRSGSSEPVKPFDITKEAARKYQVEGTISMNLNRDIFVT